MQSKNQNDSVQLSTRYQQYTFAKGHLRGTRRPEVFPIGKSNQIDPKQDEQGNDIAHTIQNSDKHRGSYIVSNSHGIRRFTPLECERLQGFPDGWTKGISDTQRYKCLGNAVTVNVIEAIMKNIF